MWPGVFERGACLSLSLPRSPCIPGCLLTPPGPRTPRNLCRCFCRLRWLRSPGSLCRLCGVSGVRQMSAPKVCPRLAAWRHHTAAAVSSAPGTRRVQRRSHAGRRVALPAQPFAASAHCRPCWVKGPQDIAAPLPWLLRFSRNPPARYRNDICHPTELHLLLSGAG